LKKIILISSGQPSLNPRLVKEVDALVDNGYKVMVLYAYWNEWGTKFDKELIAGKKWEAIRIGGDPVQQPTTYFFSRLIHKLAKVLNKASNGRIMAEWAIARSGYFLIRAAKKHSADLYIGHNIGALAATVKAAKANGTSCGFDAEDFHRNELSNDAHNHDVIIKSKLEELYIPQVDYLTTSSQQIAEAYQQLFPGKSSVIIRNVFPKNDTIKAPVANLGNPIKLFWFSQTIGLNRGLDNLMKALQLLKDQPFELHLLGNLSEDIKNILLSHKVKSIHFHSPIYSEELPVFASQFDIGLALEPAFSINNDLALSNKIFTYLQGGLAIVASDTSAQHQFMEQYPFIGKVFQKQDPQSLADALMYYHQHRDKLLETRAAALKLAHEELNWEKESQKFLTQVKQILNDN